MSGGLDDGGPGARPGLPPSGFPQGADFMLRKLYAWTLSLAGRKAAEAWLALIAFVESSIFLVPADVLFLPMALARPERVYRYAFVATAASVAGGIAGWVLGFYAYESIAKPILAFYGKEGALDSFIQFVHEYGVPAIIIKGATPIPFKVVTIAAGVAHMDLVAFIGAAIVARAMRFYLVAALLYFFGQPIREFIEKRLTLVTTVSVVVLVSGFVAVKYLF